MRSRTLDGTRVIEMGLKSAGTRGVEIFGRGKIVAYFHCRGTTDVESDMFRILTKGAVKNGAPIFRNQVGMLMSSPVTVGRSLSRMPKRRQFVIGVVIEMWLAVLFAVVAS